MKYIYTSEELQQRSPEWTTLRDTKIGASTVSAILGMNKYESPVTVWKRKLGRLKPKVMNAAMQRGVDMEDEAIEAILNEIRFDGIETKGVEQFVCIHPKYTDIMVSFDGVDLENKFIVEAKCPKFAQNFKSIFTDGISDLYYPQVQLQLAVANETWGITKAFFGSYFPDGAYIADFTEFKEYLKTIVVVDVDYDEKYYNAMAKVIEKFLYNVKYETWDDEEYQEVLNTFKKEAHE